MIDARGFACPIPVVMVQKELKKGAPSQLEVMVDNKCALENVTRFAQNSGYTVKNEERDGDYLLKLTK